MTAKVSFLVFNFGRDRLRNLWHTMNCVAKIREENPSLEKKIEFIVIESGERPFSKDHAEKTGFDYHFYDEDPLMTSHRSVLRNKAVELANGEWVIVHDNDIIPDPDFFTDILDVIKYNDISYFSNFKDVINLTKQVSDILIDDLKHINQLKLGYVNGTNPETTTNFRGMVVRPHGFHTFNEATGGSFTIKKSVYQTIKFDENFTDWGGEDNFFKLMAIKKIGWLKFGMMDKSLLHSYHNTGQIDDTGFAMYVSQSLARNRNMFYDALGKIENTLKTDQYNPILKGKIFINQKKDSQ